MEIRQLLEYFGFVHGRKPVLRSSARTYQAKARGGGEGIQTFFRRGNLLVPKNDNEVQNLIAAKSKPQNTHLLHIRRDTHSRHGYEINLFLPDKSAHTRQPTDCGLSLKNLVSGSSSTFALGTKNR